MSERTDGVARDLEEYDTELVDAADVEALGSRSRFEPIGDERARASDASTTSGLRSRLGSSVSSLFSVRWFGVATVASLVGVFLAGGIPLPFTGYLGILVVAATIGLLASKRRYVEVALAGAIAAGLAVFFDVLVLVLIGVGIPIVAIAALLGAVVGVVGHYAGRDLREGLTREV